MIYALSFILLVGILVFVHELGHFLTGKFLGVRIEAFSLGFGKSILKKKYGETEYRLSMIPLGGYVKFYGENDEPDTSLNTFDFNAQKVWKRTLIVAAGPIFNLVFAGILFALIFVVGEPNIAPHIGYVDYESPAWEAGLRKGTEILNVDGAEATTWTELSNILASSKIDTASLTIKNGGKISDLNVLLQKIPTRNEFGESVPKKQIPGVYPYKLSAMIGISDPNSFAYKQGFRNNDIILAINDKKIDSWDEMEDTFLTKSGELKVKVRRKDAEQVLTIKNDTKFDTSMEHKYSVNGTDIVDHYYSLLNQMGFFPSELVVTGFINDKAAAAVAGLKAGDRLLAINGKLIRSFGMLQRYVENTGRENSSLNLWVERDGQPVSFDIKPIMENIKDEESGIKEKRFLLGVQTNFFPGPAVTKTVVIHNPIKLVIASVEKTARWSWVTLLAFIKLFTGQVSMKAIGGPILLGKIAGDSISMGFVYFLKIMSIISINLGLINLFPIPMLDGGHLVFFSIEAIMRKPVKKKIMEIAQQVGFYILVGLMVLAFYNDILRYSGAITGLFGK